MKKSTLRQEMISALEKEKSEKKTEPEIEEQIIKIEKEGIDKAIKE